MGVIQNIIYFLETQVYIYAELFLRIFVSGCLGFLIGMDRSFKNKPAGIKTYTYVCVACTLITLISIESADTLSGHNTGKMMDPMRLAAQIVSGLGFLGAGLILKEGFKVKGLTSAAMIFFAGGVGIGIGAGFYALVIFSVLVAAVMASLGRHLERNARMEVGKEDESEME